MKRRKRKSIIRTFKFIILQLFLLLIIVVCGKSLYHMAKPDLKVLVSPSPKLDLLSVKGEKRVESKTDKTDDSEVDNKAPSLTPAGEALASNNAILIRLKDQKVLLDKSSKETIYPASLTKIMTAIVAIDKLDDLNQPIMLHSEIFDSLYNEDASMAGFLPDETVSAIDLLYGALLPSGAECCVGLSDYIAGSEDDFVDLMNEKAQTLGMTHTHFTNSTGLNDPDHYTCVEDLATLLEYALQNDTFREIFTSSRHTTDSTDLHPGGITFRSTMFEKIASPDFDGGTILGGKTGYTSEAGLCLASLAKVDGEEYILVTAGAKGDHHTEQYNIEDALAVYRSLS